MNSKSGMSLIMLAALGVGAYVIYKMYAANQANAANAAAAAQLAASTAASNPYSASSGQYGAGIMSGNYSATTGLPS